ncbi:MAG: hypothetical protein ACOZF0_21095 [Thermodesulfobacteriota bacterium]
MAGKGPNTNSSIAGDIVPAEQSRSSTQSIFGSLIDAVSQIQQFAVIERTGQDIPDDFLTIRGKLNFFNMGFGNGFLEGIIFALLTALSLPVISDDGLKLWVERFFPLARSKLFLWILTCAPIIITAGICCFLSKYRIGVLTKNAVDSLLTGRLISLGIKGVLIFFFLMVLSVHLTPATVWKAAYGLSLHKREVAEVVYRIIWHIKPHLAPTAYRTLLVFCLAALTPFFSIWLVSFYRWIRRRQLESYQ